MTLAEIKVGQDAILRTIGGQGELRHHLLDMGLTPGTEVTPVSYTHLTLPTKA